MPDLRDLLARSIFPRLNCNQFIIDPEYAEEIRDLVATRSVGGFVLFDGEIGTVRQVTAELADLSSGTLLFAADCEHGVTMRFPGGTDFPSMMALGATGDVSVTYAVAECIADEVRELGIGWNFAPVADINTNPENPIINIRAFGDRVETVTGHVVAYVGGTQARGVAACVKHFPGHGDTAVDSHLDLPLLRFDRDRLMEVELAPFAAAIRAGVKSIMVSHVAVPALDPSGAPATLSPILTEELIRRELGFDGVIVTDAMDMGAITKLYDPGEAAVLAYMAGCDVLETMPDPVKALSALVAAAAEGGITTSRIEESARRIDELARWTTSREVGPGRAPLVRSTFALEAARRSLKVEGESPFDSPLLILAMTDEPESGRPEEWFEHLAAWYPEDAQVAFLTNEIGDADIPGILDAAGSAATVVLALFVRPRGSAGTVALGPGQMEIIERLRDRRPVVLNFGNPYLLRDLPAALRIDAFGASSASLAASVEALDGVMRGVRDRKP